MGWKPFNKVVLIVPIILWGMFEAFIDPFPHSLWILRLLNTQYLVHVRVDLTVDGEALVMDRTIRCFKPVDFAFYPGTPARGDVRYSNGQAGDMLAITTSKGRFFAISAQDACHVLGGRPRNDGTGYFHFIDPAENEVTPLYLSKGELQTPVLLEVQGGRAATQVDAYIARTLLRQGYHGVQVHDVVVEKARGLLLKDWTSYEWFGRPYWGRPFNTRSNEGLYSAFSGAIIPEDKWSRVQEFMIEEGAKPENVEFKETINRIFSEYTTATQDESLLPSGSFKHETPFFNFNSIAWNVYNYGFSHSVLAPIPEKSVGGNGWGIRRRQEKVSWYLETVIPCLPATSDKREVVCNPAMKGVMSFLPYGNGGQALQASIDTYKIPLRLSRGYFLITSPRQVLEISYFEDAFKGGW